MREFAFELAVCAHLEADFDGIVSRQLGTSLAGTRVMDVVCAEPGPDFGERARLTSGTIPDAAIESRVGVGAARYWKDCFDCHPERAREATDRAVEVGFFESERRHGREYVRQAARYPENWFGRLLGIENKPDLDRPGNLERQLRTDVSLGILDEVVLATASHVTGAHLNRIPDEVGVWRFDQEEGIDEVVRAPTPLAPDEPGIEPVGHEPMRTDIRTTSAAEKALARRRIAERAYGKGWRTYGFPACANATAASDAGARDLPYCEWKGRFVDAATECGPGCPGHDPADPLDVDLDAERDRRTPWVRDPTGYRRQQAGLDRF